MVTCINCLKQFNDGRFNRVAVSYKGRRKIHIRRTCRKCLGIQNYQRQLTVAIEKGATNIKNCEKCDLLFRIKLNNKKHCKHCKKR